MKYLKKFEAFYDDEDIIEEIKSNFGL